MTKIKITFFIALIFILIISLGSISAEEIDLDDSQTLENALSDENVLSQSTSDDYIQNTNSCTKDFSSNGDLKDKIAESNQFNDGYFQYNVIKNENSFSEISDVADGSSLEDVLDESCQTGFDDASCKDNNSTHETGYGDNYQKNEIFSADSGIVKNIKVNFSNKVFENNTGNITVELPDDASGYLKVAIDDEIIYNQSITDKSLQIPIAIPKNKFPYLAIDRNADYSIHKVSVFYNDISLNLTDNTLKVMIYSPDYGFYLSVPQEILKGDSKGFQSAVLVFPSSAKGTVDVYLDGGLFQRFNVSQYVFLNISKINSLSLGNHSIKAIYTGDDYYLPGERNMTFKVVDFLINIPSKIVLDHDDCIYAKSVKYVDGTVAVYFDGKKIMSKKLDKSHEFLESLFDKVICGEHTIEVKYASSKFNYSKKQKVNISYDVDIWGGNFRYGDDNSINIIVPHDFKKSLVHITIDNKAFSSFKIDDDGWIDLNVSRLYAGNHTLHFAFDGDKKYYSYSEDYNFSVFYDFKMPDDIHYLDGSAVSIDLPSSANGNLEMYINNKLYKSVKLINGRASIKVDNFSCGMHKISLNYTGNDFKVENISTTLDIFPKIISPISITYGQNKYIVVQVSKDTKGKIIFTVGKRKYSVSIKQGKATLSLKKFNIGEFYIDVDYIGEDGFNCSDYTYVEVLGAKIKIKGAKNLVIKYTSNSYYKVKVYNKYSKLAKGVIVKFKVGKKTYKVKTNKYGVAKLKLSKFAPKKYKITISYGSTKVTKRITVKHILKLKKVRVRKSAKKLILTASLNKVNGKYLKNKVIRFKFNKKTYKAKTNKKGVAKLVIKSKDLKKLKINKKITIKAIYLKDIAKRTVKINA